MRFAIIGCGRIAPEHIAALTTNARAQLVACADIEYSRAEKVAQQTGCAAYDDYRRMLDAHPDVDVVSLLTPSGLHPRQAIDVAGNYGHHIITEKPMALTVADADLMIAAAERAGVRLFVVKQNRYNVPVVRLRQALEAGRFGRITLGTIRVRWMRDQAYYDLDAWRGTRALDGGVLSNQAIHHVDLLLWMLGEPTSVVAKTATYLVDIESEDTAVAIVTFASGATGVIEATTATRPDNLEGSLSVLGERGTVEIGGVAVNRMKTWDFVDADAAERDEVFASAGENPPSVYGFGHARYIDSVIDAIENGTPALVDGIEGRKSIALINAIYRSAETGTEVFVE